MEDELLYIIEQMEAAGESEQLISEVVKEWEAENGVKKKGTSEPVGATEGTTDFTTEQAPAIPFSADSQSSDPIADNDVSIMRQMGELQKGKEKIEYKPIQDEGQQAEDLIKQESKITPAQRKAIDLSLNSTSDLTEREKTEYDRLYDKAVESGDIERGVNGGVDASTLGKVKEIAKKNVLNSFYVDKAKKEDELLIEENIYENREDVRNARNEQISKTFLNPGDKQEYDLLAALKASEQVLSIYNDPKSNRWIPNLDEALSEATKANKLAEKNLLVYRESYLKQNIKDIDKAKYELSQDKDNKSLKENLLKAKSRYATFINPVEEAKKIFTENPKIQEEKGDTNLEKFLNYFDGITLQYKEATKGLTDTELALTSVPIVDEFSGAGPEFRKAVQLYKEMEALSPIALLNRKALSEDNFFTQLSKSFFSGLSDGTTFTTEQEESSIIFDALAKSETISSISENQMKALESSFDMTRGETIGSTLGATLSMIPAFFAAGAGVNKLKNITKLGKAFDKVKDMNRVTKLLLGATESGVTYEAAQLFGDETVAEEASFMAGALGEVFVQGLSAVAKRNIWMSAMVKAFGKNASRAQRYMAIATQRGGTGFGEVAEEYGNEIGAIINESDGSLKKVKDLFLERFGTLDQNLEFGIMTFGMGVAFGSATNAGKGFANSHKEWLSNQSDEVKSQFNQLANEVSTDMQEVVKETAPVAEEAAVDEETAPIAPVVEEKKSNFIFEPKDKSSLSPDEKNKVDAGGVLPNKEYGFRVVPKELEGQTPSTPAEEGGDTFFTGEQLIESGFAENAQKEFDKRNAPTEEDITREVNEYISKQATDVAVEVFGDNSLVEGLEKRINSAESISDTDIDKGIETLFNEIDKIESLDISEDAKKQITNELYETANKLESYEFRTKVIDKNANTETTDSGSGKAKREVPKTKTKANVSGVDSEVIINNDGTVGIQSESQGGVKSYKTVGVSYSEEYLFVDDNGDFSALELKTDDGRTIIIKDPKVGIQLALNRNFDETAEVSTDKVLEEIAYIKEEQDVIPTPVAEVTKGTTTIEEQNKETENERKGNTAGGNKLFNDEQLQDATKIANRISKRTGIDYTNAERIVKLDKERAKRISDAYEKAKSEPDNKEVKESYAALIKETIAQYKEILKDGYTIEVSDSEYSNSGDMITDLSENKNMRIFATESGFGVEGVTDGARKSNPMLKKTNFKDKNGVPLLVNDVFRFVHDFFGHAKMGNSFGPLGEENAWNVHSRMYSPLARRAMTTETRGQNSWVNFSGVNDKAFKVRDEARALRKKAQATDNKEDRDALLNEAKKKIEEVYKMMDFAEQKVTLLPEEFTKTEDEISDLDQETSDLKSLINGGKGGQFQLDGSADNSKKKKELVKRATKIMEEIQPELSENSVLVEDTKSKTTTVLIKENSALADKVRKMGLKELIGKRINLMMADQLKVDENRMGGPFFPLMEKLFGKVAWASIGRTEAKKIVLGSIGADYSVVYNMSQSALDSNIAALETMFEKMESSENTNEMFDEFKKGLLSKVFKSNAKPAQSVINKLVSNGATEAEIKKFKADFSNKTAEVHRMANESKTVNEFKESFTDLDVDTRAKIFSSSIPSRNVKAGTAIGKLFEAEGVSAESIREENIEQFVSELPMGAITMVLKVTDKQGNPITAETVDEAIISPEEQESEGLPKHQNYPWYVRGKAVGIMEETVPFWNLSSRFMDIINSKIDGVVRKKVSELKNKEGEVTRKAGRRQTSSAEARADEMKRATGSSSVNFEVEEATNTTYQQFINKLSKAFPNTEVVATQEEFDSLVTELNAKELTTKSQKVYGAVYKGKLYLNPAAQNYNTPIHEFGHLWSNTAKAMNPKLYNKGIELVKDSDYVTDIKNSKAYTKIVKKMTAEGATESEIEQYVLEEALATAIGDQGAAFASAAQKKNFKAWLSELFDLVKKLTGISNVTSEQLENMSLEDFTQAIVVDLLSENQLFVGAEVEASSQQLQLMTDSGKSMQSIIEIGRQNEFSNDSIRAVLKENGFKESAISKALEVQGELMQTIPKEFSNVEDGPQLFIETKEALNKSTEGKSKSVSSIRNKGIKLIKGNPIFKAQDTKTKTGLLNAFDKTLGINTKPKIDAQISAMKERLKAAKAAKETLADSQRRMRIFVRKSLPKSKHYPNSRVNKLIATVNQTTDKNFDSQLVKVFKVIEEQRTFMKNEVIDKMANLVKKKSQVSVTKSKKRRSKGLDAIGQSYFKQVNKVLSLAVKNDVDGLAKLADVNQQALEAALDKIESGESLTTDERAVVDQQLAFDTFGDVINMELEEVTDLYNELLLNRKESIARLNENRAVRREEISNIKDDFSEEISKNFKEIYYEDGTLKGKGKLDADRESIYESFKDKGFFKGVETFLERFKENKKFTTNGIVKFLRNNLTHFGTVTNLLDKGRVGMFTKTFYESLNVMDENSLVGVYEKEGILDDMVQSLNDSKKSWRKWRNSLGADTMKISKIKEGDNTYERSYNSDQAMRIYALAQNDVQRRILLSQGITETELNRIKTFIGEDGVKMADMMVDYLSNTYFEETNNIYSQANDVSLAKVPNYFPTKHVNKGSVKVADMESGDFKDIFTAENAPATKERTDNKGDIDLGYSFSEEVESHIASMERYKAYALGVKQMNEVLKSEEIQTVLKVTGLKELFNQSLNYAINPEAGPKVSKDAVSWFQSKYTGFALAFKAVQVLKQATSFIQAFEGYSYRGEGKNNLLIDLPMFTIDMAKVILTLPKQIKESAEISASFKDRIRKSFSGDISGLVSGGRTHKKLSNQGTKSGAFARGFKVAGGLPTATGDALGVIGYKAVYNRNIANGMSKAQALKEFNNYNSTQQTKRATEKIGLQRNTNFGARFFSMFGSSVYLQMNKVAISMNNMVNDAKRGNVPKGKDVRAFALNAAVANVLFTTAAYSASLIKGDAEDKEEAYKAIRNAALGLNLLFQIPLMGSALESAFNSATGNRRPVSDGVNPFFSIYRKVMKSSDELNDGKVIKAAQPLLEIAIGAQVDAPIALFKMFGGDVTDDNFYDLTGISASYRPGYGRRDSAEPKVVYGGITKAQMKKYNPKKYEAQYGESDRREKKRKLRIKNNGGAARAKRQEKINRRRFSR